MVLTCYRSVPLKCIILEWTGHELTFLTLSLQLYLKSLIHSFYLPETCNHATSIKSVRITQRSFLSETEVTARCTVIERLKNTTVCCGYSVVIVNPALSSENENTNYRYTHFSSHGNYIILHSLILLRQVLYIQLYLFISDNSVQWSIWTDIF